MTKRPSKRSADKRHAKPSDSVLLARLYRRQIRMDAKLTRTMRTLAEDFTRVIRQNDTLRGENETLKAILQAKEEQLQSFEPTIVPSGVGNLHCTVCEETWIYNPLVVIPHRCPGKPCPTAPIDTSDLAVANAYMSRPKRQAG